MCLHVLNVKYLHRNVHVSDNKTGRKIFVVDTSVLLYDKHAIHSFHGNDVYIPLIVLDELDRFKDKRGLIGESARYVNRYLDGLRDRGKLSEGIYLEEIDQKILVVTDPIGKPPGELDPNSADNRIVGLAHGLSQTHEKVIVVTKDINFRVKCDAVNVVSEDYYKDTVSRDSLPDEVRTIRISDELIDKLHKDKSLPSELLKDVLKSFCPNEPLVVKGVIEKRKSALVVARNDNLQLVCHRMNKLVPIKPRNKEQSFALHMMLDPDIDLVTLTGIAGSGKTFLSLMAGLNGFYDKKYKRIVITRPIQTVGKDLGFLPGDLDEKMAPWIQPIIDNFRESPDVNDNTYFDMMRERGDLEIAPLPYIRGRTFNDSFIIVDEAQNATIHELKTVITRVGEGSKIVLLGDVEQVDTPYLDTLSNGLAVTIDRFRMEDIAGHIKLPKGERSRLATLGSRIL